MCRPAEYPPFEAPSGQPVVDEERPYGARVPAPAGRSEASSAAGAYLWELVEAEIRERWADRRWYRGRRWMAIETARTYEGAVDRSEHWQALIDENDRELRTLLRLRRKARRR